MRALIDYRPALRARTGAGEYIHELTRALAAETVPHGWSIAVFTSSWKDRPAATVAADLGSVRVIDRKVSGKLLNLLWHRLEWPPVERLAGGRFDVVHAAHPLLIPSTGAAQVVTIHDLDFLRHPERTRGEIRRDYPALAAAHASRADRIVTSSQFSAGEIARELGVAREKISVCPAGAPEWREAGQDPTVAPIRVPTTPYILFLGTLEPRKNVGTLLEAYERMLARGSSTPPLVIAGAMTPAAQPWIERASRPPLAARVAFLGYVSDTTRRKLYEGALMFVLPSHHEGFGMTALEAMSLGVPIVASNRGSLPEVIGDAGLLIDPDDPAALEAAMTRLLDDEGLSAASRNKGRERAKQFTWRAAAERLIEAYELAVEARRRR
jgi:glycosyltransferase involved in cell wall biosynthesis